MPDAMLGAGVEMNQAVLSWIKSLKSFSMNLKLLFKEISLKKKIVKSRGPEICDPLVTFACD